MGIKKVFNIFLFLTTISTIFLIYLWYKDYQFDTKPLAKDTILKIEEKRKYLKSLALEKYNINYNVPILISKDMKSNLFGKTKYSFDEKIVIYLNKNRFKENVNYMIDSVLPHEYAHAVMFLLGDFSRQNGGHSKKWQEICISLEGNKCDRFVNHNDIIIEKTNPFN
ncbi:hypothetical protein CPG37_04965 [Malaciobacter canalis]|uniref:SprT-like domain-containing protein n=1 Tax=Malaciobacter canalis TaxID=1912871 RepID=A0ABX4LR18_9BACT|nr:SprT-like domain-containing protein [Malaciobacter canalis]PHO10404.1 hypothetical protein CPG37_04965 [Malaciobacter canalis]QEE32509.1 SprT-like domain-containing protein [Malaciobacter canalis]